MRRDRSVLVSPCTRTDRHTATCGGTEAWPPGRRPGPRGPSAAPGPPRYGSRSAGSARCRRTSVRRAADVLEAGPQFHHRQGPGRGITATAWSRVSDLNGRPSWPLGCRPGPATLRHRSLASACRMARLSARCPMVTAAREYPRPSWLAPAARRRRSGRGACGRR